MGGGGGGRAASDLSSADASCCRGGSLKDLWVCDRLQSAFPKLVGSQVEDDDDDDDVDGSLKQQLHQHLVHVSVVPARLRLLLGEEDVGGSQLFASAG